MKKCIKCNIEKPLDQYYIRNKDSNNPIIPNTCKNCECKSGRKNYLKNREKVIKRIKKRITKFASIINKYKSIKGCVSCLEKDPCCLDLHHLKDKHFSVSRGIKKSSWLKIKQEVKKCIVICANCHRKYHAGKITI